MIKIPLSRFSPVALLLPLLASLFLTAGCSETVDVQLEPKVDAYIYTKSKQAISLVETDAAYIELNDWLRENQANWHGTSGSYPGGVYIKSGDDGIQVTGMNVVIYSTKGPKPQARYIRHVGKRELSEVRGLGD